MTTLTLPSWAECEAAVDAGVATPIARFIYDNEEASPNDVKWRRQLAEALNHAVRELQIYEVQP